ncbi:MAG: lactaldehyde reductase [Clostridia bacterium]|nr:lactaldehyde reductase [Clostridia bacterium]
MSVNKFVLNETSYFGKGAREELPTEIQKRGFKKVLVVTDKTLLECGVSSKVTEVLDKAGILYEVYSEIKPNPTIKNVLDGVDACKNANADVIVAVGGGSSIDTAKGISIVMTNPDRADVKSLNGLSNTKNKGLPIIALPTTSGTAAEVTINYVITDEEREIKMVCVDPNDIPVLAIVDSDLMASMPKSIAAATGMDALTHAVEGYITKAHNVMADMFHMKAIELIFKYLPAAVNEKDEEAIEMMGLAQYIAGMGFSNVGLGIVHSMAHQLGAVYDTPHGIANAILLPTVMKFNGEVCADRFREILVNIGRPDAANLNDQDVVNTFVWMISELSRSVGITQTVTDVGAKEEDFDMLADKAMEDPCKPGNPREVSKEDFINLYKQAM